MKRAFHAFPHLTFHSNPSHTTRVFPDSPRGEKRGERSLAKKKESGKQRVGLLVSWPLVGREAASWLSSPPPPPPPPMQQQSHPTYFYFPLKKRRYVVRIRGASSSDISTGIFFLPSFSGNRGGGRCDDDNWLAFFVVFQLNFQLPTFPCFCAREIKQIYTRE